MSKITYLLVLYIYSTVEIYFKNTLVDVVDIRIPQGITTLEKLLEFAWFGNKGRGSFDEENDDNGE